MAEALGVNTRLIYSLTFGIGAALAGATGGLYAPTMTLVPTMGGPIHHRSLRHGRDGRRRCLRWHRAGRRDPRLHPGGDDHLARPAGGPDRPPHRRHHRHPGAAAGHLRLDSARTDLRPRWARRSLFLRLASRLEGPQTLGRGWRFWIGAAVVLALAVAYPLVTDSLHRRQYGLFLQLGVHGARALRDLGLRRRAQLWPNGLLRHCRLRLWRHHAQLGRRLRLDAMALLSPRSPCRRSSPPCSAISCSSAASAASSSAS